MPGEVFPIPVRQGGVDEVHARLDVGDAESGRSALVLAHGAGAGMESGFLEAVAAGLAARGLAVLRFRYAYAERMAREKRRLPPDRRPTLLGVHRAAVEAARERLAGRRLLLGGKSMGGRMASHLAAEGTECAGLVFFGYPLHPPGRPEKPRSEHFGAVARPALFLQGTRDALCRLEHLQPALRTWGGRATLEVIEGADHDFRVPKAMGMSREQVLDALCDAVDAWERATFPA